MADEFASPQQAMGYLARALPEATSENPKYRNKSSGALSVWQTDEVRFGKDAGGAITVTMRERYWQHKDGKTTPGTHEASFSLADVDISELTDADELTGRGEPARGILFACGKPGCVAADWSGHASRADKTDISIQNDRSRDKILAAFRYLKTHGA